jgi:flagellar hook protein FlgE
VQGYTANADELTDITLKNVQSAPSATTQITIGANLDDTAANGDTFNVSQNVFDSKGKLHNLSITFLKTPGNGMWGFEAKLDGDNLSDTDEMAACGFVFDANGMLTGMYKGEVSGTPTASGAGTLSDITVNKPGQIYQSATGIQFSKGGSAGDWSLVAGNGYSNATAFQTGNELYIDLDGTGGTDITIQLTGTWNSADTLTFNVTKEDKASQDLILSFGDLGNGAYIGVPEGTGPSMVSRMTWDIVGDTASGISGYASTSVVKSLNSNGYASGVLKNLSIEGDGAIYGIFTNGQTSRLGQVILADFPNVAAMKKVGNYFAETNESGEAITNQPGSGGLGEVLSNSLEISNTDTAKEFVNMITAQRAYQASARVITTANDMLTELMNIKR